MRDPARRAGPGQADQVLGADVGREDRRAHDQPAEVAAGQEVVVGRVLASPDDPGRDAQQQAEVRQDDQPVDGRHWIASAVSGRPGGPPCPGVSPARTVPCAHRTPRPPRRPFQPVISRRPSSCPWSAPPRPNTVRPTVPSSAVLFLLPTASRLPPTAHTRFRDPFCRSPGPVGEQPHPWHPIAAAAMGTPPDAAPTPRVRGWRLRRGRGGPARRHPSEGLEAASTSSPPCTGTASITHMPRPWVAMTIILSRGWMTRSCTKVDGQVAAEHRATSHRRRSTRTRPCRSPT